MLPGLPPGFAFVKVGAALAVQNTNDEQHLPLYFDYGDPAFLRRLRPHDLQGDPLIKALGKPARSHSVWDATGGTLTEALMVRASGRQVQVWERSPIVQALCADALERASRQEPWQQLLAADWQFHAADAREVLVAVAAGEIEAPHVIMLDPMFPAGTGKRRKSMHFLRTLVGEDPDAGELCAAAINAARYRVIVKRPRKAPPLRSGVNHALQGKSHRFDIYVKS